MIVVADAAARSAPRGPTRSSSVLRRATFTWDRGVLAIVGAPVDGTTALLEMLAGRAALDAGRVTVGGHAPRAEAARPLVAHVPMDAALPDALRVHEVVALARTIRREPPCSADAVLAPLGLSALAPRRASSLTPAETRAVLLAIALASNARVLLLEEPLAGLEPSAPARVIDAIRARAHTSTRVPPVGGAHEDACVIVTTASVRDATRLADQLGLLTQGVFSHLPPALAHVGPAGAKLRVVVRASDPTEASPFVAALSAEPGITAVESVVSAPTRTRAGTAMIAVAGPDLLALARAVGAAAARSSAVIEVIESAVMPIDAIRAALVAPRGPALPSVPPGPVGGGA
ncbi:MAG: ATP-binding cassette domain-containing protein [Deltaproteobacteria bacterium]|nr:ATP-binding cassette domain-containing protein [Deltaproteobacteria bacterium]